MPNEATSLVTPMAWTLEPTSLEGRDVRLVPLGLEQVDALCAVGLDADIWRWMPVTVSDRAGMERFVQESLDMQQAGTGLPFAMVLRETGHVIGSTRFMNAVAEHRRVEIGGTWIAPEWQRSRMNTEAKYLMLRHAFERLGCLRVEFKTHVDNARSRSAILRLGAVEEGTFRKHMVQGDGSIRDTVYFSIVDDEWPTVKARLESRLALD